MSKTYRIAVIPGDGIGKEVMPEGLRALEAVGARRRGTRAIDQFARAHVHTAVVPPAARPAGGPWPRKSSASTSTRAGSAPSTARARVCLESFSPTPLQATGRWA